METSGTSLDQMSKSVSFEELKTKWTWKPIHNCPGRFILDQQSRALSPEDIIGGVIEPCEFQVEGAKDTVIVVQLSEGGLISYGTDPAGQFRQAALYIVRILTGAKPADLPVQQPTKFELALSRSFPT